MYKAGIIGLGRIGVEFEDSHASAYRDCPDIELVAACDANLDRARMSPCPLFYTDYEWMVAEEQLDIVSICTPPETHYQIVCDIAPYVKAIYCEKPIATTLEDADRMIGACQKAGVILQVNHQRSFVRPKFRFSRGILNTGTHMFALLRQLFGEIKYLTDHNVTFESGLVCDIEEVKTDEPIFELDCTHNKDRMILAGVEHLVECLKNGAKPISSGEDAREALYLVLKFQEACAKL